MALSETWADKLTNMILGTIAVALPTVHIQLYTTLPALDGTGGVTPTSADGYAGPIDVSGATFWATASSGDGSSDQAADINFGTPTNDWGQILGMAFVEADGTMITQAEVFSVPLSVTIGTPFVLNAGSITFLSS